MKQIFTFIFLVFLSIVSYAQPINDDCGGIIDLGVVPICDNNTFYTNFDATETNIGSENIPACFNGGIVDRDVWFQFTTPANITDFTITITGITDGLGSTAMTMPQANIYRGDCMFNGLSDFGICGIADINDNVLSFDAIGLDPNETYFIRINDYSVNATPNWGSFQLCIQEFVADFVMGEVATSNACVGTIHDSGGPDGDYSINENLTFTVCPSEFHQCIELNVAEFNMENNFDELTIHSGTDISAPIISTLTGAGTSFQTFITTDCFTLNFTSDGSVVQSGFTMTWQCSSDVCDIPPPVNCDSAVPINTLPFNGTDLSTCWATNSFQNSPCGNNTFLGGEEYVFAYNSPGDECIMVDLTGSNQGSGVMITDGCGVNATDCIAQAGGNDPTIQAAFLEEPGIYYIVVSNAGNCTPFNINIQSVECPITFPSAALCEDALSLNGCSSEITPTINVEPGQGDPNFITDLNRGCIVGPQLNYTFFYFQAQADGFFSMYMFASDPAEASDIDFNVWGPFENEGELCDSALVTQPIRSSYAGGADPTGMSFIHPVTGLPVTDEYDCLGNNDDFVTPIPVLAGEYYLVWIDDFGSQIVSGSIDIDFSGTSVGVLDGNGAQTSVSADTVICPNETVELLAEGGEFYEWGDDPSLSCTHCANPIASPTETTIYQVDIHTICGVDTRFVTVEAYKVKAGNDVNACIGEVNQIIAGSDFEDGIYSWSGPDGFLSCMDCFNPVFTATEVGSFEFIVTLVTPHCILMDTMNVVVVQEPAPLFNVNSDTLFCVEGEIQLASLNSDTLMYTWSSLPAGFMSNDPNPTVTTTETTTYYVTATNGLCPFPALDSVSVNVAALPILNAIEDTTLCLGEVITLGNTTTEDDVVYNWSGGEIINDNNMVANPFASPDVTSSYVLTANRGICLANDTVMVTVNSLEMEILGTDTIGICKGGEVIINTQLSSNPNNAVINWTDNMGTTMVDGNDLTISPGDDLIYYAEVTNINRCYDIDSVYIHVDSLPADRMILPQDTTICQGEIVILTSPLYEPSLYPTMDILWTPSSGQLTGDSLWNLVVQPGDTTEYIRTINSGGCVQMDTTTVNVDIVVIVASSEVNDACPGDVIQLNATTDEPNPTFVWEPTDGLSCSDCPNPMATVNSSITYNVTIELDDDRCPPPTVPVSINVIPFPGITPPANTTLCNGESVTLNQTPNASYTYTWSSTDPTFTDFNAAAPSVTPSSTQTYTVEINNGCMATAMVTIVVVDDVTVTLDQDDTYLCNDQNLVITANAVPDNNVTYTWSHSSQVVQGNAIANIYSLPLNGYYNDLITVTADNGCNADQSSVTIIRYGFDDCSLEGFNIFSPNNDGLNDFFLPSSDNDNITVTSLKVFNRFGSEIFNETNPTIGWDGTFNGKDVPADVYVYIIEYTNVLGEVQQLYGDITVVR